MENVSGQAVTFAFNGRSESVPANASVALTECTPGKLLITGVSGQFAAADGTVVKVGRDGANTLKVDVVNAPLKPKR